MPSRPRLRRIGLVTLGAQALLLIVAGSFALSGARAGAAVFAACAIGALTLSAVVVAFAARRLRLVAVSVGEAAAAIASGDYSFRLAGALDPDGDALARAVNGMAHHVGAEIDALRDQRDQQEAILQSMGGGVIALDLQQRILRLNLAAERMLGLTGRDVRGRLLQEAVRQPDLNRFVAGAIAEPSAQSGEFELAGKPPLTVRASSGPLRDADGAPVGLLVMLSDVTQLRRLETMRTDFAANVSHELRTPITNIKGYLETLLETGLDDREQSMRFLETIARNADRLGAIIEDMLTLTRLERSESEEALVVSPTPVNQVVDAVLAQLEPDARAKRIQIDADVPLRLRAMMNAPLVEQALANLVSNALKYSPEGTRVAITARAVGERGEARMIEISVADEGPGIAPEYTDRIFERFYRIDKARSREQGGTGLGLSIVKHIALVHGGRVDVESTPGRGSTFRLFLPAA